MTVVSNTELQMWKSFARREDLRSSHHEKECEVVDGDEIYHGEHFAIHTDIKS